jgi:hypothetical protein
MIKIMNGRVCLRIRDEEGERGLGTARRSPRALQKLALHVGTCWDHLFAMLSLTLVRLDSSILEPLELRTSDTVSEYQNTIFE